ncbi:unnamed protein product [Arctogadus glacialis]
MGHFMSVYPGMPTVVLELLVSDLTSFIKNIHSPSCPNYNAFTQSQAELMYFDSKLSLGYFLWLSDVQHRHRHVTQLD